jgi:hypothetical protein
VYEELYNTIGRRFITLGKTGPKDVSLICKANGVTDTDKIAQIESACPNDLRPINKLIYRAKAQLKRTTTIENY